MPREILTEVGLEPPGTLRADTPPSWWERYAACGLLRHSETARGVLESDVRAIVGNCIPSPAESALWPETRVRTGIVVGAVQSGKTAAMLAMSALLLDQGVDVLIILAGTRIALWKQTYERLLKHLDGSTPETAADRWSARVIVPHPVAMIRGEGRAAPLAYMSSAAAKIEQALLQRRPTILVIPKIEAHVLAVSRAVHERFTRIDRRLDRFVHMVVMDDEADDASVLDARDSKTIPRRIEMLWSEKRTGATISPRLYATYIAFTATPQANFLQQSHNPLAPRSFCAALRAPYKRGATNGSVRSATYAEPEGIARFYCGGEFFYDDSSGAMDAAFCRPTRYPDPADALDAADHERRVRAAADRMLIEGLRAYLVAAAVRAFEARISGRLLPSEIGAKLSPAERDRLPAPTCMLVHPSALQDLHFDEARRLVLLSAGANPDDPQYTSAIRTQSELALDVAGIRESLAEPVEWRYWLESYRATLRAMSSWPGAGDLYLPKPGQWDEIAGLLSEHVLPYVRVRVVNSDPGSDERPQFEPSVLEDGTLSAPPDVLTIFVAGNVMSRGLTIEGLTTTVFTRPASEPVADVQMQMQRWFGYRGPHAHLCRLFAFEDQLQLFRTYHEHDVAMRTEILASMDRSAFDAPNIVLQGPRSLATAKVPTSRLPLHPGATPSIRLIERDEPRLARMNADILAQLLERPEWVDVGPAERPRGRLLTQTVALDDVAALLDRFRYASYDPGCLDDERYSRWRSLEDQLRLLPSERPLFRPPNVLTESIEIEPRECPYSIAAYLRLWSAALKRPRCDGLYPSDSEGVRWALAQPLMRPPAFYIGVAFGEGGASQWADLALRGVRAMTRSEAPGRPRMLNTLWGRRSEGGRYHGDQLFDYNYTRLTAPQLLGGTPVWRERGHPGLVLFHVIRSADGAFDAVTVGLAIPHGGPEQFAALPAVAGRT